MFFELPMNILIFIRTLWFFFQMIIVTTHLQKIDFTLQMPCVHAYHTEYILWIFFMHNCFCNVIQKWVLYGWELSLGNDLKIWKFSTREQFLQASNLWIKTYLRIYTKPMLYVKHLIDIDPHPNMLTNRHCDWHTYS